MVLILIKYRMIIKTLENEVFYIFELNFSKDFLIIIVKNGKLKIIIVL